MRTLGTLEQNETRQILATWFDLWGCGGLEKQLEIAVNRRFRTTLGRYEYSKRKISVAAFLIDGPELLLKEVLCHEAAHAAVAQLYSHRVRPHGPEWRSLMRMAGYKARATMRPDDVGAVLPKRNRRRSVWEHRCLVCKASRDAGRPVRQWRCATCLKKGLSGILTISRLGEPI